ncbi:hypothetical protein N0V90_002359 [Kalmusia sp. IMI 367209]|nr:hypothetical protein N0V90_002359 [Kalmusia sp. IMI 367209]
MVPHPGFSDNALRSRSDLIEAAFALIKPLEPYKSPTGARIKLAASTGAGFSETAAQLEGFARPLWVVAELLRLKSTPTSHQDANIKSWIQGLKVGTDPQAEEYWGDLASFDQRMVEMETIAFALLTNPSSFDFASDPVARTNLVNWLRQINEHTPPQNNWLWFRVLVNLALVHSLGVPLSEVKTFIDSALDVLDTFFISDGWSSDGLWGEVRKQADYYSGSFAIQFAQCLFVKFARGMNDYEERIERYKVQAREFAVEYWRYFDIEGYCYPNMHMAEEYNSPQSVYWSLKSFLVLGLKDEHPFWTSEELPHPLFTTASSEAIHIPRVKLIWPPRHILVNAEEHHFLLSSEQSTSKHFKAREAKYAKFAYSSAFGFSVPCGSFLEQLAPDSTLATSLDDGEETWKARWEPYDVESGSIPVGGPEGRDNIEELPTLMSKWKPWKRRDIVVQTTLVATAERWPGWHLRVHQVRLSQGKERDRVPIRFVDGGFAVSAQTMRDASIFEQPVHSVFEHSSSDRKAQEGWWNDRNGSLVISKGGASGLVNLTDAFIHGNTDELESQATIIRADPNTSVLHLYSPSRLFLY